MRVCISSVRCDDDIDLRAAFAACVTASVAPACAAVFDVCIVPPPPPAALSRKYFNCI